ncbi:cutinase family protein [Aeromicrobium sp. 50.2.37]|uniref:cutinase family protein n=1 Tax=Aeromicrobium sp. 50.2.37 TaxID=2969305 RepID=UPI00214FF4FF|nr:cutinase family protein [Aeromicrobium sp. 50.2.37]MCR4512448.1 cutinase family protein [Aeromicrobium sp. 50.2.37]
MPPSPRLLLPLVACVLVLTGCSAAGDDGLPEAADGCPQVQVVGVRGQSQSLEKNRGLGTEVEGVVTDLVDRLTEKGVDEIDVAAVRHRSRDASDIDVYDADVDQGRRLLARQLTASVRDCPDARLAVVGFSQGAQIAQETLADRPALARHVDALALIGSPRHDPDAAFTRLDLPGPAATRDGSLGAGPDLGALDSRTVDACLSRDVVCDADGGTDYAVHKHGYEDAAIASQVARAVQRLLLD